MPRIPVRTEPYTDLLRQHRHYKNKRDLILRSLGKASYINGSQFAIVFISAKGDVEKYVSEMIQPDLDKIFDWGVLDEARGRVKEINDRRREMLVEEKKKEELEGNGSGGGGDGEGEGEEKPLAPSEVLRSAKKKKRELLQAQEKKRREEEEKKETAAKRQGGTRRTLMKSTAATNTRSASKKKMIVCESDEEEVEEEEEDQDMKDNEDGMSDFLPANDDDEHHPQQQQQDLKPVFNNESSSPPLQDINTLYSPVHGEEDEGAEDDGEDTGDFEPEGDSTLVEIDDGTMIGKIDTVHAHGLANGTGNMAMIVGGGGVGSTPARAGVKNVNGGSGGGYSAGSFMTPAPSTKTISFDFATPGITMMNGQGQGQGSTSTPLIRGQKTTASTDIRRSSLSLSQSKSNASVSFNQNPSHHTPSSSLSHFDQPETLTIPSSTLSAYYVSRFNQLQQMTCKLVVKTWIKVIEPKKQSRFPYNKGEEGRPSWWPEDVRHKEPDHLMKPERTELLLAILRSPLVKVINLEIATAEASPYISQGRMKILREIYRVAKEEEKRRGTDEAEADIVIQADPCPTFELDTPAKDEHQQQSLMPYRSSGLGPATPAISNASAFAAKAIMESTPSRAPSTFTAGGVTSVSGGFVPTTMSTGRGRKRQFEESSQMNKENMNLFVGALGREHGQVQVDHHHQARPSGSGSASASRRPKTEPRPKKAKTSGMDMVTPHYRQGYQDFSSMPFSSSPLQHGAKWTAVPGSTPLAAPRSNLINAATMLMDQDPMTYGNVSMSSRSPALDHAHAHAQDGMIGQSGSPHPAYHNQFMMHGQAAHPQTTMHPGWQYQDPSYVPAGYRLMDDRYSHPGSATIDQQGYPTSTMTMIPPQQPHQAYYSHPSVQQATYISNNINNADSPHPTTTASSAAFGAEVLVGNGNSNQTGLENYTRSDFSMGDYVAASSGYSVQNPGEFPFAATQV